MHRQHKKKRYVKFHHSSEFYIMYSHPPTPLPLMLSLVLAIFSRIFVLGRPALHHYVMRHKLMVRDYVA